MSAPALAALLFGSGTAALVYETLWVRQMGLVVGVDVYAVTTVVSAFFAGLGAGSVVLGARADGSRRPLLFLAALEGVTALLAAAVTLALGRLAPVYVRAVDAAGAAAWVLPLVLVAAPAFVMGGTLPAAVRAVAPEAGRLGIIAGRLYAANTAGGVVGALATVFVLVPALGVRGSGLAAAALNAALAVAALALGRAGGRPAPAAAASPRGSGPGGCPGNHGERSERAGGCERGGSSSDILRSRSRLLRRAFRHASSVVAALPALAPRLVRFARHGYPDRLLALVLYGLAGAVALGYEVVWTQAALPFLDDARAAAFALVLATYLAGLVAGSALWARLADRVRRPWTAFGLLELGAAAAALGTFAALGGWLPRAQQAVGAAALGATGSAAVALGARMLLAVATLLLVPSVLLGATFPAAARLACGPDRVGRDVGTVAAMNIAGGVAGTCLTGFVLVPRLGLVGALAVLAVVGAAAGGAALVRGAARRGRTAGAATLAVVAIAAGGFALPRDHVARAFLAVRPGTLLAYEESFGGTVAVVDEPFATGSFRRLYIHGVSNSSDALMARRYMRLQALVPLLIHEGESRTALVVGLGTGTTCGALLVWPGLERRVCVELLPAVVRAARHFAGNYGVADDPRVEIRVGDGRHELLRHDDRFDLITLEPPPPVSAGSASLYSRDFYALCRRRLAPHGLMAQWLPLSTQNGEDTRALVRAFLDVFPHATLWTTETHEALLVGSVEPIVLDPGRMAARLAEPPVAAALAEVGIADLPALLATYLTDRAGLEAYAGDVPAVTDDRPRIEHAGLVRPGEFPRTLRDVLRTRRDPPLDEALLAEVRTRRRRLIDFYQAAVFWYAGAPEEMEPLLARLFDEEPGNPYYRWFVGR